MLARVRSSLLQGIDALPCEIEVDYDPTAIDRPPLIVGLPDAAVKESLERVRAAMTAGEQFGVPNSILRFRHSDGTAYPQTINGRGPASEWKLIEDVDSPTGYSWVPHP